jgi:uncharacterized repeat protein (TIGR01451 family)
LRIPIFFLMTALVLIAAGLLAQQDEPEVDLQVTKTVDNDTPDSPGQTIEFAIEIKNLSETTAENIVVEDRLPPELAIPEVMVPATSAGTYDIETALWRIDEIAPGQAELLTLPAIVSATPQPACIRNRATLVSTDAVSHNNASDAIIRRPDI